MLEVEKKANLKEEVAGAKPLIVVGIPAFNEEKTIAKVVLQAKKCSSWVVVCDDGSSDMTTEIAESLGVEVVRHNRNLGYGAALQSLFRRARELGADVMVTCDGDGQHDPAEIPLLVDPVLEGKADVVIGSRFLSGNPERNNIPRLRRWGIKAITKLMGAASHYGLSDAQSGFRVYGRKALDYLSFFENGMGASVEVLMEAKKHGLTIVEVPAGCDYQELERSSLGGLIRHGGGVVASIVRLIVEERPLVFLGIPGVVLLLIGVLFGTWMLQIYATAGHIVTNIALASIAFTLVGLFATFTAITLYSISRLMKKKANHDQGYD